MTENRRHLPILPLQGAVLFPGVVGPIELDEDARPAVEKALSDGGLRRVAVVTVGEAPRSHEGRVATEAEIVKVNETADGPAFAVVRGLRRVRVVEASGQAPGAMALVEPVEENVRNEVEARGIMLVVQETIGEMIRLMPGMPLDLAPLVSSIDDPALLADLAAHNADTALEERLKLLEESDVITRLKRVLVALRHRVEVLKVRRQIDQQVSDEVQKTQREFVLRQQLKAIEAELGEGEASADDAVADLEARLAEADLPDEVADVARKQLARLGGLQQASPEYTVTRTYLEWILELPWTTESEDRLDLAAAREQLDRDHYGLDKVKKRIVEYLAVRKLAPGKKAPILCLVGPPGVGKTSLGRSVAGALGRQFVRLSLGGVRDEAEIRGHRRTYVGALPGRIVQGLKRAGTRNPVFMLDEVDKLGRGHGDPAAALLEVLDPEQNNSFSDHYLELPFDLSKVLFIVTANHLDPISGPLRDRLEIIEIPGYSQEEKREIAKTYLVPRQLSEHGLTEHHVSITDEALDDVIHSYTREAGVRSLERELGTIFRQVAVKVAAGESYKTEIEVTDVDEYLGPPRFFSDTAEAYDDPGVATGLAWTPAGGEVMFVEVGRMKGKGKLDLTGQLGSVMKESAQAALSYVRAHAEELGIDPDFYAESDLHVHLPAGAVPKDGPSAGVAVLLALVSRLSQRKVRHDVAVTGEINLRGQLLPVGGIKAKVLAAHRAGVRRVILPERNRKDLVEIPRHVLDELDVRLCKTMSEVIPLALEPPAPAEIPVFQGSATALATGAASGNAGGLPAAC